MAQQDENEDSKYRQRMRIFEAQQGLKNGTMSNEEAHALTGQIYADPRGMAGSRQTSDITGTPGLDSFFRRNQKQNLGGAGSQPRSNSIDEMDRQAVSQMAPKPDDFKLSLGGANQPTLNDATSLQVSPTSAVTKGAWSKRPSLEPIGRVTEIDQPDMRGMKSVAGGTVYDRRFDVKDTLHPLAGGGNQITIDPKYRTPGASAFGIGGVQTTNRVLPTNPEELLKKQLAKAQQRPLMNFAGQWSK